MEAEVYSETANPQQAEDEIPAHWRSLPRTYAYGDRVQANLEDNSKVLGVAKRVYVKSSNGNAAGQYKISWEGTDVDEMDVSDAESDNLEPYEGDASRGFFEVRDGFWSPPLPSPLSSSLYLVLIHIHAPLRSSNVCANGGAKLKGRQLQIKNFGMSGSPAG